MNIIVAGSREFGNYTLLSDTLKNIVQKDDTILSGGARGADRLGERYAKENSIKCKIFPADWNTHGSLAGRIRNKIMLKYGDILVAFWNRKSKGAKHMIDIAKDKGIKVIVVYVK